MGQGNFFGLAMTDFKQRFVQCLSPAGLHRMAYKEWGEPDNDRVLLCLHGLTRVSSDFDVLAGQLSQHYRVVCPDIVGRGLSDWLRDASHYVPQQYVADMVTLMARLDAREVHVVGTSMGGIIGMALASLAGTPVTRLVLNDIGPAMDILALQRIGTYIGVQQKLASFDEAAAFIRAISVSFGPHTEQQWHKLCADVLVQDEHGQWGRDYDPGLAVPYKGLTEDIVRENEALLWDIYGAIGCPTLVVRGAQSDLLSRETALRMTTVGPKASLVEIAGVGHAPTLVQQDQINIVSKFLLDA